jgi:hypothetical protein
MSVPIRELNFAELEPRWRPAAGWPWTLADESPTLADYLPAAQLASCSAYGRLLHPLWEDLAIGEWDSAWPTEEDAPLHRGELDTSFSARGLKWHDLAEDLEIDYVPGMALTEFLPHLPAQRWPRALVGPVDGSLDMERLRHVIALTRKIVDPAECHFAWCEERCFSPQPRAYAAELEAVTELFDGEHTMGSPTVWGDAAGSFLLVTPPHRAFTVLAGPEEWIHELCEHKPLDAERLDPAAVLTR